jgi:hypothetical protein
VGRAPGHVVVERPFALGHRHQRRTRMGVPPCEMVSCWNAMSHGAAEAHDIRRRTVSTWNVTRLLTTFLPTRIRTVLVTATVWGTPMTTSCATGATSHDGASHDPSTGCCRCLDDAEGNRHGDEGTDKRADYRQAPPISSAELHTLPPRSRCWSGFSSEISRDSGRLLAGRSHSARRPFQCGRNGGLLRA